MIPLIDFWQIVNAKASHPAYRNMRFGQIAFNTLTKYNPELAEAIRGTAQDPFYVENHLHDRRFLSFCDTLIDNWER